MSDNGESTHTPVVATKRKTRGRKFDSLMAKREETLEKRVLRAQRGPKYQEQVRELAKRGESISAERLGSLSKALLEKDLIHPPKDPRTRVQLLRAGLEAGGVIGPKSVELHLHEHHMTTLPPVVQKMLLEKMAELSGLQKPVIEAAPSRDPFPGEPKGGYG
jgi:hypothetical protein